MAATHAQITPTDGIVERAEGDQYGRRTVPGAASRATDRRLRKLTMARNAFFHRPKNGVYDPFSHFHLVETLLNIEPGRNFTAAQLSRHLDATRPVMKWDPVAVGRILSDLRETFADANPGQRMQPILVHKRWNGTYYELTDYPEAQAVLFNLAEDLTEVGNRLLETELVGRPARRLVSPLAACPSVMEMVATG